MSSTARFCADAENASMRSEIGRLNPVGDRVHVPTAISNSVALHDEQQMCIVPSVTARQAGDTTMGKKYRLLLTAIVTWRHSIRPKKVSCRHGYQLHRYITWMRQEYLNVLPVGLGQVIN